MCRGLTWLPPFTGQKHERSRKREAAVRLQSIPQRAHWWSIIGGSVAKELLDVADTYPAVYYAWLNVSRMTTRRNGVKFFCGRVTEGCRLRTDDGVALVNRAVYHAWLNVSRVNLATTIHGTKYERPRKREAALRLQSIPQRAHWWSIIGGSVAKELWMLRKTYPAVYHAWLNVSRVNLATTIHGTKYETASFRISLLETLFF